MLEVDPTKLLVSQSKLARKNYRKSGNQLAFYWINDENLITCQSSNALYEFNDDAFIWIVGLVISKNREYTDGVMFYDTILSDY